MFKHCAHGGCIGKEGMDKKKFPSAGRALISVTSCACLPGMSRAEGHGSQEPAGISKNFGTNYNDDYLTLSLSLCQVSRCKCHLRKLRSTRR